MDSTNGVQQQGEALPKLMLVARLKLTQQTVNDLPFWGVLTFGADKQAPERVWQKKVIRSKSTVHSVISFGMIKKLFRGVFVAKKVERWILKVRLNYGTLCFEKHILIEFRTNF